MPVDFMVKFRTASEVHTKDSESQTKWMPFDVTELRENTVPIDGKLPANRLLNYSEEKDGECVSETN